MNHKLNKYLSIARSVAQLSKDPSTQVGALILGPSFEVRSLGYNGAPRGCKADEDWRFQERTEKLYWSVHAEANAIAAAARMGVSLEGCTAIITHFPCTTCMRLLIQAGINRVAYPTPDKNFAARWSEEIIRSQSMAEEVALELIEL